MMDQFTPKKIYLNPCTHILVMVWNKFQNIFRFSLWGLHNETGKRKLHIYTCICWLVKYVHYRGKITCMRRLHNVQKLEFEHNDISKQQDAAKFVLLILLSLPYMFWVTVSPIFRGTLTLYKAFWDNVPTLLSAPSQWHRLDRVPSNLCHRSAAESRVGTVSQKALYRVKVPLKMGETVTQTCRASLKESIK